MWAFLASAAIQAGVSIWQASKEKDAANQNAATLEEQAEIQRKEAQYAKDALDDQANDLSREGASYISAQKGQYASAGVKTSVGSPLSAMRESQMAIDKDVGRIKTQGRNALELGLNQADVYSQQADMTKKYAKNAMTASYLGAGASLLGAIGYTSQFTDKW